MFHSASATTRRLSAVLVAGAMTIAVAPQPAASVEIEPTDHRAVVERALESESVSPKIGMSQDDAPLFEATGETISLEASLPVTAPANRETFATRDALIAVLEDGESTASFGLPTGNAQVLDDGSVLLKRSQGQSTSGASPDEGKVTQTARLDAPWAVDANGERLRTWYSISGSELIQHVDTDGAEFPIAADPRLTYGWGVYLNITGAEAKAIATAIIGAGGAAAVATCSGLGKLPTAVTKVAALACTAIGAPTLKAVYSSIVSLWRSGGSASSSTCYQRRIVGTSTGWHTVALSNCLG